MATATRSAKPSKTHRRRPAGSVQSISAESRVTKKPKHEPELSTSFATRGRDYHEAPEAHDETFEQPETKYSQESEAPDAGEGRCYPSDESFTHGRSWS